MTFEWAMHTVSEANARGHWATGARRAKQQRALTRLVLTARRLRPPAPPLRVTLVRVAPSRGLDGDNLQRALKAVRDGVADWLGIDDGDPSITWEYGQRRGLPRQYAVSVEVSPRG